MNTDNLEAEEEKKKKKYGDKNEDEGVQYLVKCRRSSIRKSRWGKIPTRIDDLTNALLVEILVRLPIKSAHQCKPVSKRWHSLISDPWFCRSYVRRQTFFINGGSSIRSSSFTLVSEYPNEYYSGEEFRATGSNNGIFLGFLPFYPVCVMGSSNDLLLCCCCAEVCVETVFYICNPFTKHYVKLPTAPKLPGDMVIGFRCEPHYKVVIDDDGGGHCHVIDSSYSYRVIRTSFVCFPSGGGTLKLDVFSSETCQWSKIVVSPPCPPWFQLTPLKINAIFSNGRLHWITAKHGIYAFDPFAADRYTLIDLPAELKVVRNILMASVHLAEFRGRLRILGLITRGGTSGDFNIHTIPAQQFFPPTPIYLNLRVWELKDYSAGEWCIVHDIRMDLPESEDYLDETSFFPFSAAFHPFNEDIVYLWLPSHFIVCNLRSAEFQLFCRFKSGSLYHPSHMIFSLVQQFFPTPVTTGNSVQVISESNSCRLPKLEL